jgi:EAL and modified HD-GYP domain-containing signal transduction protein
MSSSTEVFMARQPIYSRGMELFAYELLFRKGDQLDAGSIDSEEAAVALISCLIDIGLNELIGDTRAFINISEELLLSNSIMMFPKEKVVIEVLETVTPSPEVVERVRALRELGFTIALDDFKYTADTANLVPEAHFVKLDVLGQCEAEIKAAMAQVNRKGVQLLAEKVETLEQFRICEKLGFDLFQGYFFAKPELVKGSSLHANQISMLRLAAKIQTPDLHYSDLEEIICSDVALTFRLLKLVRSAHFGLGCTITSIHQALMFLGINTVSSLATLLAMVGSNSKPNELLTTSLVRGKMCELLAKWRNQPQCERYFTLGMLSMLDALLDLPMTQILQELPLCEELNQALSKPELGGDLAETLSMVTAYERGDWDAVNLEGITPSQVSNAYHASVTWSGQASAALAA